MPASIADLATFFDASPNPYLVLDRALNIATANKAYLASVRRELPDMVGRWAWDAFPTDEETLRQAVDSFQRVLWTRQADTMALLRFDVPRPASEGGGLEKRYWSITHTPVLGDDGEVSFVLQHPIDVTDLQTLRQTIEAGDSGVQLRPDHSGIFDRAKAVYRVNQALTAEAERNAAAITALTDEREKLIGLFEQAPAMIALLLGSEHRFAFANASYRASVGQRELIGRTVVEALSDAAEQGYVALLDHAFATGEPYQARGARYDVQAEPDARSTRGCSTSSTSRSATMPVPSSAFWCRASTSPKRCERRTSWLRRRTAIDRSSTRSTLDSASSVCASMTKASPSIT